MKEFNRKIEYEKCLPEKLVIDKIGWTAFLNQWNDESLMWVKKKELEFGPSFYIEENYWKKYLAELEITDKYMKMLSGKINYPPKSKNEQLLVKERLNMYQGYIQLKLDFIQKKLKDKGKKLEDESAFDSSAEAIIFKDSLMFEPADEMAISNKEQELGIRLPDSYKDFLQVSNGWVLDKMMLLSVEDISWTFSAKQASYIFWEEMLEDPNLQPGDIVSQEVRDDLGEEYYEQYEFERTSILISKRIGFGSNYLIFNPHMITSNGDWLGWKNYSDGSIRSAYQMPKMQSFESKMEFYYIHDVARRCVDFKELEHKYSQQ